MRHAFPFFAATVFTLLTCASCTPSNSNLDDGKSGYQAPPAATNGNLEDTTAYNQRNRDTLHTGSAADTVDRR